MSDTIKTLRQQALQDNEDYVELDYRTEAADLIEKLQQERDELAAHVERLTPFAYRCLWMAYVWNDHNFKHPQDECRNTAVKHGVSSLDEANCFISSAPAHSLSERDYRIAYNAFHAGVVYADTVPKGTGDTPGSAEAYADSVKRGKA